MRVASVVAAVAVGCATALGYGGFGVTALFADVSGLNERLTELNTRPDSLGGWGGTDTFRVRSPLWWVGEASVRGRSALGVGGRARWWSDW